MKAEPPVFDLLIAIVNWNTVDMLRDCLNSLRGLEEKIDCVTVVVDNDSADASADMVRAEFPWVRLIANETNTGFAAGNNQAFSAAESKYTLVLNPDTSVPHETVIHMLDLMEKNIDYGIVTPRLIGADGKIQHYYYKFFSPAILIIRNTFLDKVWPFKKIMRNYLMLDCAFEKSMEIEQASASCVLVRNSALGDEDLFDERFPIFFNDVDLSKRVFDAGHKVYYTSEVDITHYGGESLKLLGKQFDTKYFTGSVDFIEKHHGRGVLALCAAAMFILWIVWLPLLLLEVALSPKKKIEKINRQVSRINILAAALAGKPRNQME